MKKNILILGSGKMATNIGSFLMKKGHPVTWLSEDNNHLATLESKITKIYKRIQRYSSESIKISEPSFYTYHEKSVASADIIIESTTESRDKKREALSYIEHLITDNAVLLSNSSSILPREIHPACIGCHFFYPVELTGCIELLFPTDVSDNKKKKVQTFLKELDLQVLEQSDKNAFAVNRLLLPLQNEILHLLRAGYDPRTLEEASALPIMQIGQLSCMDAIGLDVIYASIQNYIARMPEAGKDEYNPLLKGLMELTAMGKYGDKNKNGLLTGDPLPWAVNQQSDSEKLKEQFQTIFRKTCYSFINNKQISLKSLAFVLSSVFQSEIMIDSTSVVSG